MLMPEATVHKAHSSVLRKDQIRLSRQLTLMEPISEPQGMQGFSENEFRFGVFAPYAGHHAGAGGRVNNVGDCHILVARLDARQPMEARG